MEIVVMFMVLAVAGVTLTGVLNPKWIFGGRFKSRVKILIGGVIAFILTLLLPSSFSPKVTEGYVEPTKELNATEKAEYAKAKQIYAGNDCLVTFPLR